MKTRVLIVFLSCLLQLCFGITWASADGCCVVRYTETTTMDPQLITQSSWVCANSPYCKTYRYTSPTGLVCELKICYAANQISASMFYCGYSPDGGCIPGAYILGCGSYYACQDRWCAVFGNGMPVAYACNGLSPACLAVSLNMYPGLMADLDDWAARRPIFKNKYFFCDCISPGFCVPFQLP
jgi:hypothetical protein